MPYKPSKPWLAIAVALVAGSCVASGATACEENAALGSPRIARGAASPSPSEAEGLPIPRIARGAVAITAISVEAPPPAELARRVARGG